MPLLPNNIDNRSIPETINISPLNREFITDVLASPIELLLKNCVIRNSDPKNSVQKKRCLLQNWYAMPILIYLSCDAVCQLHSYKIG